MSDKSKKPDESEDTIVLGPKLSCGHHLAIRERNGEPIALGSALSIKDPSQVPEGSEVFTKRADGVYRRVGHAGPALVASPEFKDGWERIFGGKQEVGQA
jgi:hypothetical protein